MFRTNKKNEQGLIIQYEEKQQQHQQHETKIGGKSSDVFFRHIHFYDDLMMYFSYFQLTSRDNLNEIINLYRLQRIRIKKCIHILS